jgi:hypothetical protein
MWLLRHEKDHENRMTPRVREPLECSSMSDEPRKKRVRPVVPYAGHVDASGGPGGNDGERRQSRPVVLLLVFLVLAVMGWFLIQNLTQASKVQDCVMAGRKNCAPIDTSGK